MRAFLIAMAGALALSACASHSSGYTRTDGVPVDPQQVTLAQLFDRARKEAAVVNTAWRGMVTFKRSSDCV